MHSLKIVCLLLMLVTTLTATADASELFRTAAEMDDASHIDI